MFLVKPSTIKDYEAALELLDDYHIIYNITHGWYNKLHNTDADTGLCEVIYNIVRGQYHKNNTLYITSMDDGSILIIVKGETEDGDLRLCEMAFQMNFKQDDAVVCDMCEDTKDVCGHLTFTEVINGNTIGRR